MSLPFAGHIILLATLLYSLHICRMGNQVYTIISFLGGIQGILLSGWFFSRKITHPASRMLGCYILIFSAGLFETFLQPYPALAVRVLLAVLAFGNFLYGPLIYLFVSFLTTTSPRFGVKHLFHFIPFVAGLTLQLLAYGNTANSNDDGLAEFILFEILVIQLLTYNIVAIRKLVKHRRFILDTYSSLETGDYKWLQFMLIFITAIYALSFGISHFIAFGNAGARAWYVVVQILIMCAIYLLSYRLIQQPRFFMLQTTGSRPPDETSTVSGGKYLKSGLKQEQVASYLQTLLNYMETQKPYLDPDLSVYTLSENLSISKNHLTEIINKHLNKNFFEFVNAYRVDEVKSFLTDPAYAHLNLSALGLRAGFKSKTAFNANFKQITGYTPSEWKKRRPDNLQSATRIGYKKEVL